MKNRLIGPLKGCMEGGTTMYVLPLWMGALYWPLQECYRDDCPSLLGERCMVPKGPTRLKHCCMVAMVCPRVECHATYSLQQFEIRPLQQRLMPFFQPSCWCALLWCDAHVS